MSAALSPAELVDLLNELFTRFYGFVAELGLEKMKTVGGAYMVVGGVPAPRADHAHAIADLALRIRDHVAANRVDGRLLSLRIGINSGPVTAGITGSHKFAYHLWGDTVNTASRMESVGVPGSIQVSPATYGLIQNEYVCEARGSIPVKGRGEMEAYLLVSKRCVPRGRLHGPGLLGHRRGATHPSQDASMTSAAVARLLNTTSRPGPQMKISGPCPPLRTSSPGPPRSLSGPRPPTMRSSPPLPFRMSGPLPPAMQASSRDVPSRTVGPFSPVLASHASSAKAAPPGQAKRNKARTAVSTNPITAVATKRSRSHTILSMTPTSAACCSPEHRSSLPYPGDGSHRPKVVGRSEVLTGSPRARISQPGEWLRRPLVVGDSAELVCDLDEVGLVAHHHVERLVGRGMLVQQLARLVTLPRRLSHRWPEVLDRERPARLA